jgi:dTDP-4-dehydrorhamnose 3,5-epimerase
MKSLTLDLEGLLYFEPTRYEDNRGFLYERYNSSTLETLDVKFVQQNVSVSKQGIIRGMHWQYPPYAQGKLVTCLYGEIFDVAVDIRLNSSTFGKHVGVNLSGSRGDSLWIPKGFAHGFQALTQEVVVTYSVDGIFAPDHAGEFNPLDENLKIMWPLSSPTLSEKDRDAKPLASVESTKLFS